MKQYIPIIFVVIAGCLLVIIAIRNKIPLWGGLLSSNIKIQVDKTDKWLAFIAFIFFLLSMIFLVLTV